MIIAMKVVWLVRRFQREAEAAKRAAADDKQRLEVQIASMRVYTDSHTSSPPYPLPPSPFPLPPPPPSLPPSEPDNIAVSA